MRAKTFIVFDVETATSDLSSVSQIGFTKLVENAVTEQNSYLIPPTPVINFRSGMQCIMMNSIDKK